MCMCVQSRWNTIAGDIIVVIVAIRMNVIHFGDRSPCAFRIIKADKICGECVSAAFMW